MPTENRSSNTEMVSVPPYIGLEPLAGCYYPAKCRRCGWVGSSEELTEDEAQCTRHVGDRLCLGDCDELERDDLLNIIQAMAKTDAQHLGKPVGLPARKPEPTEESDVFTDAENSGFNACLDEIATLGPLYIQADPGEVERLTEELRIARDEDLKWQGLRDQEREIGELRAQLAGRDALLDRVVDHANFWHDHPYAEVVEAIVKDYEALSASAEPSAPVERDERAEFEACIRREWPMAPISRKRDLLPKNDPCYGDYCDEPLQRAWIGWQMRAALDRKPS